MRPRLPRTSLLLKMLACVALVVSGLPVWAAVCRPAISAKSGHVASSACAMPCCAPKARAVASPVSCCPSETALGLASGSEPPRLASHAPTLAAHGCVLNTVEFGVPALLAVNPTLVAEIPALLPAAPDPLAPAATVPLARLRVGIVGTDAGPPPDAPAGPESGRSPPSARR